MTTPQPELSPGWYPDRITPGMNRWWDGTQWTSHTQQAATGATPAAAATAASTTTASMTPAVPVAGQPVIDPATGMVPGYVRPPARNGIAWGSMILGIVAVGLAIYELTPASGTIFISTSGIFAIVLGARALGRRRNGQISVLVPEIIGIVLGAIASVIFLFGFVLNAAVGGFN
jgi:hypothetical protein